MYIQTKELHHALCNLSNVKLLIFQFAVSSRRLHAKLLAWGTFPVYSGFFLNKWKELIYEMCILETLKGPAFYKLAVFYFSKNL